MLLAPVIKTKTKVERMKKIDIQGIEPTKQLFHNEWIDVYPKKVSFDEITYWPQNLRTILAFEMLEAATKKPLKDISRKEITHYLAAQPEIKLPDLAASIKKNGVRVPLIILNDGTLLDGNRRYFACSLLQLQSGADAVLEIPAWVIKKDAITDIQKKKILAEANFVSDYKVDWPLDVKAKVVSELYHDCIGRGLLEEDAYHEINDIYGQSKSDVKAYVETVSLTQEYVDRAGEDVERKFQLRHQVLMKFVYFWEFRNKALRGRGALDDNELKEVRPLFFTMIENKSFNNLKQIEPMIRSCRQASWWQMLTESQGRRIEQVDVLFRETKAIRSAEDKVRNFLKWLEAADTPQLSDNARRLLDEVKTTIDKLNGED